MLSLLEIGVHGEIGVHKEIGVFLGEGSMFQSRLCCSHRAKWDGIVERGCLGGIPGSCCRGLKSLPA